MGLQTTLALRYLGGRRLRTALTTLAIMFGVLVIFGMNTVLPAFVQAFQANVLAASGQVDATITLKTGDTFPTSTLDRISAVEGVRAISGLISRPVSLPPDYYDLDSAQPDLVTVLSLVGIDIDSATAMHSYRIVDGRFLQQSDEAAAVISQSLSSAIRLGLGDELKLPTAAGETRLTIVGILPARALPGNEEVLVNLQQAQSILGAAEAINAIEVNYDRVDSAARSEVEAAILERLGNSFQLGALDPNSQLLTNIALAQGIFNMLGALALAMGGFIILNTFRTIVAERRRDIGMLRTLGANRSTIFGIFTAEALIQGLVGTALGMAVGYGLGTLLSEALGSMLAQFLNLNLGGPIVSPGLIAVSVLIGLGVTLLAALLPAVSAARVAPLEALRPTIGEVSFQRLTGWGFWLGVAMIAAALAALFSQTVSLISLGGVLFMLGLILASPALILPVARLFSRTASLLFARAGTAQLAEGNLARQPSRAAVTASTTLIGMAILVMASAVVGSISIGFERVMRRSLGSDLIAVPPTVTAWGNNLGSREQLADELRQVEGIGIVSPLRYAPTQVQEQPVSLLGIDPATYPLVSGLSFSEGDETSVYTQLGMGRNAIVSPLLVGTTGIGLGDSFEMLTPEGAQIYTVVAVGSDYLNAKVATVFISIDNIARDFGQREDVLFQMGLATGADSEETTAAVAEVLRAYPQFRLINGQAYVEENLAIFDAAFAGMYALVILLAIPSLIAMVNTLAIGVIERTREIGMLRAVGATRGQVRTIILAEAIILAAIGTSFGVAAGMYLGYVTVQTIKAAGFPMEFVFPLNGVLLAVGAGIVFGILAAIIPARQATRLQVVEALRYE
jgi:putative ABC transport system permease protein